jgi:hypothetical protein
MYTEASHQYQANTLREYAAIPTIVSNGLVYQTMVLTVK